MSKTVNIQPDPALEREKGGFAEIIKKSKSEDDFKVLAGSSVQTLDIGALKLECYVAEVNGEVKRLVARGDVQKLFLLDPIRGTALEEFFQRQVLKDYVSEEVLRAIKKPVYGNRDGRGIRTAFIQAELVPELCDIALRWRRDSEAKHETSLFSEKDIIAIKQAEIVLAAVAKVGIIALVDEATGYQKQKDEYYKLLQEFISESVREWVLMFPENWFKQVYRLYGWNWNSYKFPRMGKKKNHPQAVSWIVKKVYERMPNGKGLFKELKELTPRDDKGNTKHRFTQRLTDSGRAYLSRLIGKSELIFQQVADNGGDIADALREFDEKEPNPNLPLSLFDSRND